MASLLNAGSVVSSRVAVYLLLSSVVQTRYAACASILAFKLRLLEDEGNDIVGKAYSPLFQGGGLAP